MERQELRHIAQRRLRDAGIENADAEADWILMHTLGIDRHEFLERAPIAVNAKQLTATEEAVARRAKNEPLQYILGDVDFCDCTIAVTPDVLIPRPETEWIVETLLEHHIAENRSVLDIGTGSGCIAIAVAARTSLPRVTALDISPSALRVAGQNAAHNRVQDRVTWIRADMENLPFRPDTFDTIVSNPPYIPTQDIATLDPDVRDHEPLTALDGGIQGTDYYAALGLQTLPLLRPGGQIWIELPGTPPNPVIEIFEKNGFDEIVTWDDWSGKPRLLRAKNPA